MRQYIGTEHGNLPIFYVIGKTGELLDVVDKIYDFQNDPVDGWKTIFDDRESGGEALKKLLKQSVHIL